jgi:hypothetical protein
MSLNKAMNVVIAVIEERPGVAKDILRHPTSDVKNVPEVLNRLQQAVRKNAANEIRQGLMNCLHIQPRRTSGEFSEEETNMFFHGVRAVEDLFESLITELEA